MANVEQLYILAAGQGKRLGKLTTHTPKCLIKLAGQPLLQHQLNLAKQAGISNITVLAGCHADALQIYDVNVIRNPDYATTNMVRTLLHAEPHFSNRFIVSYGDIVYSKNVLNAVMASEAEIGVVVDSDWRSYWERRFENPLLDAESLMLNEDGSIKSLGQKPYNIQSIEAQYIGLMTFNGKGVNALRRSLTQAMENAKYGSANTKNNINTMYMTDLLQTMIDQGVTISAIPIKGEWLEIDTPYDLELGERLIQAGRLSA